MDGNLVSLVGMASGVGHTCFIDAHRDLPNAKRIGGRRPQARDRPSAKVRSAGEAATFLVERNVIRSSTESGSSSPSSRSDGSAVQRRLGRRKGVGIEGSSRYGEAEGGESRKAECREPSNGFGFPESVQSSLQSGSPS